MNVMTSVPVRADPAPFQAGPARFSSEEFLRMTATGAFDDIDIELIEGGLQRMPPPGNSHSAIQAKILLLLGTAVTHALLRVETGIDLGDDTIVSADVVVLTRPVDGSGLIPAEEVMLVVEVSVSTRDRDLGLKRQLYAAAGIPTYWVIDADRGLTHVFDRPENGDYMGLSLARFGEALAVPGTDGTLVIA